MNGMYLFVFILNATEIYLKLQVKSFRLYLKLELHFEMVIAAVLSITLIGEPPKFQFICKTILKVYLCCCHHYPGRLNY